jgi:hypothetical protein
MPQLLPSIYDFALELLSPPLWEREGDNDAAGKREEEGGGGCHMRYYMSDSRGARKTIKRYLKYCSYGKVLCGVL